jgi:hypothetical protein
MRLHFSGTLSAESVKLELTSEGKTVRIEMPIEANNPIVSKLMLEQLERPIPFWCFVNNSPDTEGNTNPFIYRNLIVGVSHIGPATREEIVLRVKKAVLEHESKMEKLRRDVTILEVSAPPKKG